ncbi:MAG: glycosyltransferase, partial [bacterium]
MDNKTLKLLFFVSVDWYFYSHRFEFARRAIKKGYDVILVSSFKTYKTVIESNGIKCVDFDIRRSSLNPFLTLLALIKLMKIYNKYKPDIVYQVALKPVLLGTIAAAISKTGYVVNTFGGLGFLIADNKNAKPGRWIVRNSLRIVCKLPRNIHFILQTQEDLNAIIINEIADEEKCSIIQGVGVNTKLFKRNGQEETKPIRILFAARLIRPKGLTVLLDASNLLLK